MEYHFILKAEFISATNSNPFFHTGFDLLQQIHSLFCLSLKLNNQLNRQLKTNLKQLVVLKLYTLLKKFIMTIIIFYYNK